VHVVAEPFDDRRPAAAIEREAVEEDDRRAGAVGLVSELHDPLLS
jgi:hypothetical protein